ncbi:hypothetical protein D3C80_1734970 [compost metagenome]
MQILDGFLQVRVVGERVCRAHHRKTVLDEGADVLALQGRGQALLNLEKGRQVAFGAPVLRHGIAQQGIELAHQGAETAHIVLVELGHMGAATRQDSHQMTPLEDQ